MIYHSSSYLGLLLFLEESVLSAAVTVGRYLFLFTLAILEQSLAIFNRLLYLGKVPLCDFNLMTDFFQFLTIFELLLSDLRLNVSGLLQILAASFCLPILCFLTTGQLVLIDFSTILSFASSCNFILLVISVIQLFWQFSNSGPLFIFLSLYSNLVLLGFLR